MFTEIIKWYLIAINIITFILFGADKIKAIRGKWRISEMTLIGFSFIGGTIGGLCGMYLFRHKTKKLLFKLGLPAIFILQIAAVMYFKELT